MFQKMLTRGSGGGGGGYNKSQLPCAGTSAEGGGGQAGVFSKGAGVLAGH